MIVKLSEEAQFSIQEYRNSLSEPKYNCSKKRIRELCKMMIDTVVKKASNSDSLQVCPYKTLGQEKDKEGNLLKQNLRWFQYKSPSSSTWGVSVLCDFEHDVAIVHRIVHSSFIKESSKWIPIQDFNKQIQEENTMKWKRINESSMHKNYTVKYKLLKPFWGEVIVQADSEEDAARRAIKGEMRDYADEEVTDIEVIDVKPCYGDAYTNGFGYDDIDF